MIVAIGLQEAHVLPAKDRVTTRSHHQTPGRRQPGIEQRHLHAATDEASRSHRSGRPTSHDEHSLVVRVLRSVHGHLPNVRGHP